MLLGLFLANDGFALACLEGLDHAVVVALYLLALVLLLLDLHLHELDLLLSDGLVLVVLVLEALVLLLDLLKEVLQLFDALALLLRLLFLLRVEFTQMRVVLRFKSFFVGQRAIQQLLRLAKIPTQFLLQMLALSLVELQLLLCVRKAALRLEEALI